MCLKETNYKVLEMENYKIFVMHNEIRPDLYINLTLDNFLAEYNF